MIFARARSASDVMGWSRTARFRFFRERLRVDGREPAMQLRHSAWNLPCETTQTRSGTMPPYLLAPVDINLVLVHQSPPVNPVPVRNRTYLANLVSLLPRERCRYSVARRILNAVEEIPVDHSTAPHRGKPPGMRFRAPRQGVFYRDLLQPGRLQAPADEPTDTRSGSCNGGRDSERPRTP